MKSKIKIFNKIILSLITIIQISYCADNIGSVEIIHWNDFHAANLPYIPTYNNPEKIMVSGYANFAGYIDSLRILYPKSIALHAGDDFQGSPVSSITHGYSQILILNEILPDAFTIGNHEFDYGQKRLKKYIKNAKFSIISSNIFDDEANELFTKPYKIIDRNNVKIAVIGTIFEGLKSSVGTENVIGISILNPLDQIKKYVKEVENISDLIIVLSHSGFQNDSLLAENLDKVDVIIGGHSHSWLKQPVKVNDILICQAGGRGERLGLLKLKVDLNKDEIVSSHYDFIRTIVGKVKKSEAVSHIVDSLESKLKLDKVIGELEVDWIRNSKDDSNIGMWICDAMNKKFKTDIALQNSGGIRKNMIAGPIRIRDLWEISPFDNTIMIVEVSGKQLFEIMQWRIDNPRDLLQIAGMKVVNDYKAKKLIKITINGKDIDKNATYSIATNNYIVGHSARFLGLENNEIKITETSIIGRDVLIDAVQEQKIIKNITDDRIIDISK